MFHVNPEDLINHKEATKSRQNLLEIPAGFQQVAELHLQDRLLPILRS
jgi:hypothetical protein